ncbi:MAG TPA: helix-turn-helix domain-containing protein [Spirochaetia bacterium]|nr:helix-turn-helix domain-containing protein [Spirochaetia bacterium]
MHIAKDYDDRKAEFLDTAMRLFMQNGYEQTSVNAIIDAVGVSKGAFYHYFKTKEDLLDELAARASAQALEVTAPVLEEGDLNAVEKLNELFRRTNSFKAQNRELMIAIAAVFYSDANVLLRRRLTARSTEMVAPLLARIIEEGNAEASMSVRYPNETARFVLRIGSDMVAAFAKHLPGVESDPEAVQMIVREVEVYTEAVERILGLEPGSLTLMDDSMMTVIRGE